jgi:hypothetical protein
MDTMAASVERVAAQPLASAAAPRNWSLTRDPDGIAWLTLDKAGTSTNTLSSDVMAELSIMLDVLDREPPKGLVIRSGKASGFIAGADVAEFSKPGDVEANARELVSRGMKLFDRLAAVAYPTSWTSPRRAWACPKSCWASCRDGAASSACRA